jgi:hypothetical protein
MTIEGRFKILFVDQAHEFQIQFGFTVRLVVIGLIKSVAGLIHSQTVKNHQLDEFQEGVLPRFRRYCLAAIAALAPSPEAIIIRFPKQSVTSPAAKTPGQEVEQSELMIISPLGLTAVRWDMSSELSFNPIATKTPFTGR